MTLSSVFDLSAEMASSNDSIENHAEEELSFFSMKPLSFTCSYSKAHGYLKNEKSVCALFKALQAYNTKIRSDSNTTSFKNYDFHLTDVIEKVFLFGATASLCQPYSLKSLSSLFGLTNTKIIPHNNPDSPSHPHFDLFTRLPIKDTQKHLDKALLTEEQGSKLTTSSVEGDQKETFRATNCSTDKPSSPSQKYTLLIKAINKNKRSIAQNNKPSYFSTSAHLAFIKKEEKHKQSKDQQHQESSDDDPKNKKKGKGKKTLLKSSSVQESVQPSTINPTHQAITEKKATNLHALDMLQPLISPPQFGIYSLYYLLTKQGILSDFMAYSSYKQDMNITQKEMELAFENRLIHLQKAVNKEKSVKRWSALSKFFSWLSSFVATVTGAILMCTGVGSVVGAMIFAAGVFSLTNAIMEWTGGWKKIAEILPGDDIEKKRTTITWIRMGINILSLIFSIVGVIWGGYSSVLRSAQSVFRSLIGLLVTGFGVTAIGEGITSYQFHGEIAAIRSSDVRLEILNHNRNSLMERGEWDLEQLEKLFEKISYVMELNQELFLADMSINRK